MVWNTIAHPKMMAPSNDNEFPAAGDGATPVLDGPSDFVAEPVRHMNTTKMAFYDFVVAIIESARDTEDPPELVLVKGDFEAIKHMILSREMVRGMVSVFYTYTDPARIATMGEEIDRFSYVVDGDVIEIIAGGSHIYLRSDNTLSWEASSEAGESDLPAGTLPADGRDQSELMP